MAKKTVVTPSWYEGSTQPPAATVEGGCVNLRDASTECPSLGVALTGVGSAKEGGFPPLKIQLCADGGVAKVSFIDAYNKRSAYVTLRDQGTIGEQLQKLLEAGNFDWRPWGKNKTWG